jgi:hypothetical protein
MSLNIKNPETDCLIRELAGLKGVSLTTAVTIAVRSEIDRERSLQQTDGKKRSRMELLKEYSEQTAPLFKDGRSGNDLINDLYDETTGLPK